MHITNNDSGALVKTKSGEGYTKNSDKPVNGKVIVYLNDGKKILCDPEKVKVLGFYD